MTTIGTISSNRIRHQGSAAASWMAWIAVAVLLAGVYFLYALNKDLRQELNQTKTQASQQQQAQQTAAQEQAAAQADELAQLRRDKKELVQLRGEIGALRPLKDQVEQLQQENAQLKASLQQFQASAKELSALKTQNQQLQGALSQQQQQAHMNVCTANRRSIQDIKLRWATDFEKQEFDSPAPEELFGPDRYLLQAPSCPSGGVYTLGSVQEFVTCSLAEHQGQ